MNKKNKTAAFVCNEIIGNFQLPLYRAVKQEAEQRGQHLIVFEGRALNSTDFADAEHNYVYQFINPELYDALILSSGSLFTFEKYHEALTWLEKFRTKPIVSLNIELPGCLSLLTDGFSGVKSAASHLIEHHGYQHVAFVSGPPSNAEAEERKLGYLYAMEAHGLKDNSLVIDGSFLPVSGIEAMKRIIEKHSEIQAIIFANDDMAIAALDYINQQHPELKHKFAVVGFDNTPNSKQSSPVLATISQAYNQFSQASFNYIEQGKVVTETVNLPAQFLPRESCGCKHVVVESPSTSQLFSQSYKVHENLQLTDHRQFHKELAEALKHLNIQACFIAIYSESCAKDQPLPEQSFLYFAYSEQNIIEVPQELNFKTKQILPAGISNIQLPTLSLVKTLFYQQKHFGYVIYDIAQGKENDFSSLTALLCSHLYSMFLLHELQKAKRNQELANQALTEANDQLVKLSTTDSLTGLHNRRGFFDRVYQYAISGRSANTFMAFYADVDFLKTVNDGHGHAMGDLLIQRCGNVLKQTFRDEDFIGRVGGDEFLICARHCNEEDIGSVIGRLKQMIVFNNRQHPGQPELSVSVGYAFFQGRTIKEIETAFERADKKLYEAKKLRHITHKIQKKGVRKN